MGKTLEQKKEMVSKLRQQLSETNVTLVIDYQGLTVSEITDLRQQLRSTGASCSVAKNTLMRIAVEGNQTWQPMTEFLKGTSAFLFLKEDLRGAIEAYEKFQKASKKTELRGGVMEGRALTEADVKALKDLPTREELMARIAGAIKAVPTKLAVATNAVPTKLAVGIKEVPNKLVRAIKAIADKENGEDAAA